MIVCRFPLCASRPSPVAKHTISSHSSHCKQVALMTLKAFFCDYCARPGGIMVTVVDSQSVYLASAFLAVSSHGRVQFLWPPSSSLLPGHSLTIM